MKVLMIEDAQNDIEGIVEHCKEKKWDYRVCSFEKEFEEIEEFDPDVIILDLQKKEDESFPGSSLIKTIWEKSFRPFCVFSGQIVDSVIEKEEFPSPLVKFINKGDESPVIEYLSKIEPYIEVISNMQKEMKSAFRRSFDVFDQIFSDGITDGQIITYLCNTRMKNAFMLDLQGKVLPAWAQYEFTLLSNEFTTGDIICSKEYDEKDINDRIYYVILSQSCDIIHKKVDRIIVAKCQNIKKVIEKFELGKSKDRLKGYLNMGYFNNYFFLPSFLGRIPELAVDLKDIITIERENLKEFVKIISLSSPYTERLIWAYMQNACRPGVPSLDVETWAKKIMSDEEERTK